jgi:hypothetical protein
MSVLIQPYIISAPTSGSSVASLATAAITLPANLLICIDVVNRHSTPASLGTVTLSGSTLGAISARATVTEGGASPTRRLTRFYTMVSADLVGEVLTATASGVQTGIGMRVTCLPGVYASLGAAGAVRGSTTANSAGANVTTLATSALPTFGSPLNGGIAGFISSAGGLTPRYGWTEIVDVAAPSSVQYELQWCAGNDTVASATQASATLAAIFDEIVAAPNPVVCAVTHTGYGDGAGYSSGYTYFTSVGSNATVTFRARRSHFVHFIGYSSSHLNDPNITYDLAFPYGLTASLVHSYGGPPTSPVTLIYQVTNQTTLDISGPITVRGNATGSGNVTFVWEVIETQNLDMTRGTNGVLQIVSVSGTGGQSWTVSPAAFGDRMNSALLLASAASNGAPITAPTPTGFAALAASSVGGVSCVQAFWRPSEPNAFSVSTVGGTKDVVLLELASFPASAPTVALVSPPAGTSMAPVDSIVVDFLSSDDRLATATLYANGEQVTADGVTFAAGFTASSVQVVTHGKRITITRTGGWSVGPLGIYAAATDAVGQTASATYGFTVVAPTVHYPDIALVAPANPGSLAAAGTVTLRITDADGDLASATVFCGAEPVYSTVTGFASPFTGTRTDEATGFVIAFGRTGGFQSPSAAVYATARDAAGRLTYAYWAWEVTGNSSGGHRPVVTIISPLPANDESHTIARTQHLRFRVTDVDGDPGQGGGLEHFVPLLLFPDGTDAVIHDGESFRPRFSGSTRWPTVAPVAPGFEYDVIWHTGLWPQDPILLPWAWDMTGLEAL